MNKREINRIYEQMTEENRHWRYLVVVTFVVTLRCEYLKIYNIISAWYDSDVNQFNKDNYSCFSNRQHVDLSYLYWVIATKLKNVFVSRDSEELIKKTIEYDDYLSLMDDFNCFVKDCVLNQSIK